MIDLRNGRIDIVKNDQFKDKVMGATQPETRGFFSFSRAAPHLDCSLLLEQYEDDIAEEVYRDNKPKTTKSRFIGGSFGERNAGSRALRTSL